LAGILGVNLWWIFYLRQNDLEQDRFSFGVAPKDEQAKSQETNKIDEDSSSNGGISRKVSGCNHAPLFRAAHVNQQLG
jgi:hypothetical protein